MVENKEIRVIGSRREPMIDDWLIEKMREVEHRLHHPTPRNVALRFNKPWEGNTSGYYTVLQDGEIYRLYYRGSFHDPAKKKKTRQATCYVESGDGIKWTRPELGIHEYNGSKKNNIIWVDEGCHNFSPFKDKNPDCKTSERYKAVGSGDWMGKGLYAYKSRDGITWSLLSKAPIITEGKFDSQNLAFWDSERGEYRAYIRDFRGDPKGGGIRDIKTAVSKDFVNWSKPEWLDFGGAPLEHLYTNAATPMPGADHILVGFPKRFVPNRKRIPEDNGGVSDAVFMSSRDGTNWRRWTEAFIRPGLLRDAWFNRNNMPGWGLVYTKSERDDEPDLSMYVGEAYYTPRCRLRRYTIRRDGFVSIHAGGRRGEFTTKPLTFEGSRLFMNFSTSAAGSVRVEIRDAENRPQPGYALTDCPEIYGDSLNEKVVWKNGEDVSQFTGRPIRLRFVMQDADIFAIQFGMEE